MCLYLYKTLRRGTTGNEFVERLCEDHDIDLQVFDLSEIDLFEAGKNFLNDGPVIGCPSIPPVGI